MNHSPHTHACVNIACYCIIMNHQVAAPRTERITTCGVRTISLVAALIKNREKVYDVVTVISETDRCALVRRVVAVPSKPIAEP